MYCYCDEGHIVPDSPELRRRAYLDEYWVQDLGAYDVHVSQIYVLVWIPCDRSNEWTRDGQNDEKAK